MGTYELYTIGYEGRKICDFVDKLKQFGVSRLIDVREIPISRKRGFSKKLLDKTLQDEGIEYIHMKILGSPSAIRNKLKIDRNYDYFFIEYEKYLNQNIIAIKEAHRLIGDGINCIMCFERLPDKCHRSVVAKKIKEYDGNGLIIKHI